MSDIGQPDMRTPKVFRYEGKDYVSMDEYLRLGAQYRDFYSPQWIPVEERLPATNERVLIFCPLLEPEEIIGATFLMASARNGGAWSCDDGMLIVETKPSHWMNLPTPPEEER